VRISYFDAPPERCYVNVKTQSDEAFFF